MTRRRLAAQERYEHEKFKHIAVRIPESLNLWLRVKAAHQDMSRSDIIRDILWQAMMEEKAAQEGQDG